MIINRLKKLQIPEQMISFLLIVLIVTEMLKTTAIASIEIQNLYLLLSQIALSVAEIILLCNTLKELLLINEQSFEVRKDYYAKIIKALIPLLLLLISCIVFYARQNTDAEGVMVLITLAGILKDYDYKKLLRIVFVSEAAIVVLMLVLSLLGVVTNFGGNAFGFIYRTDYAAHLLFLILIYCMYYSTKYLGLELIVSAVFAMIDLMFIKGKTAFMCVALIMLVNGMLLVFKRYKGNSFIEKMRRIAGYIMLPSFLVAAAFSVIASALFKYRTDAMDNIVAKVSTLRARLILGYVGFEQFEIKLFGNDIFQNGWGGKTKSDGYYFYLDNSYVRMLLLNGIIVFLLFIGIMTYLQVGLHKKGMYYEMFLLTVVAINCIMEHHLMNASYNAFALLIFANLDSKESEDRAILFNKTKQTTRQSIITRLGRYALISICLVAIMLGIISSYRISTYSGSEPLGNATIILPVNIMEEIESEAIGNYRNKRAVEYLKSYPETACIIAGKDEDIKKAKAILENSGIDSERIYPVEARNLESAISNSYELLNENGWKKRIAFCSPRLQQERIHTMAHELKIPMNPLYSEVPTHLYIVGFVSEQIKILKAMV